MFKKQRMYWVVVFFASMMLSVNVFAADLMIEDNGDGALTDYNTDLVWAKDAGTPNYEECTGDRLSWINAQDYINCLNINEYLGYNDWRLPTIQDISTMIVNKSLFDNIQGGFYWSSTEKMKKVSKVYAALVKNGKIKNVSKAGKQYVLPVRDLAYEVINISGNEEEISLQQLYEAAAQQYLVTVGAGPNGNIVPGTKYFRGGKKALVKIIPNKGYMIESITVDGMPQDLGGRKLTKPYKIVFRKISSDHSVSATFIVAPKISSFPTNLTEGTYEMETCVKVPSYINQCFGSVSLYWNLENVEWFISFFNNKLDDYVNQILDPSIRKMCSIKYFCNEFDGYDFTCSTVITCSYGGQTASGRVNFIFTKVD